MVSILWGTIFLFVGILGYVMVPLLVGDRHPQLRKRVGDFYLKQSLSAYDDIAIVRREMGGYDIFPISVDNDKKLGQVTLEGGLGRSKKKLQFRDPDDRIASLYGKSIAIVDESVPAATDAELAEIGEMAYRKDHDTGIVRADGGKVDPYVPVPEGLHVCDPSNTNYLLGKSVEPENIETTVELTKQRFSKYGGNYGVVEAAGLLFAFGAGAVGVVAIEYLRRQLLGSGGSGAPGTPETVPVSITGYVADLAVMIL